MSRIIRNPAIRPINGTAVAVLPAIPVTDGELLMRYARHGDDGAFAELVEKHGRLVWSVCWQVLRQHHEIEDAFQATFFILAKRARTIRSCDSLCGWLYRVAYRTALRSRMASKRKALVELMSDELSTLDEKLKGIEQHEQRAVLMEELHLLPEKYQMPLVLCYLEGKSRRATAEELGITLDTVKGQLSRGRQLLRHRLIRRGVSLSLAMAAMALPVKSAAAAVTPQLVGLTVAGCGKWLAGGAAVAVASTITTSTKVIHLAHQGTVAMTIASFAKPAVVAISLLGAMSATLAVDSADKGGGSSESQTIDLQANEEAIATVDETASDDGEGFVQVIAGEVAVEDAPAMPPSRQWREGETLIVTAPEMPRQPAPMRSPQPVKIRGAVPADVLVPSPVVVPGVHADPFEFAFRNEFKFENSLNLDLQVKVAELETQVVQLQLESKELEIEAIGLKGVEKEELLRQSREKLLMAEAAQLKIQIERQQAQLEEMKKQVEQQAKEVGEQAKKAVDLQAEWAVRDADFAAAKVFQIEKQAEAAVLANAAQAAEHAKVAVQAARNQAAQAADQARSAARKDRKPVQEFLLTVGDKVKIEVDGAFPDRPISDVYTIEPMGTVALGASYGRVSIAGQSLIEAEQTIVQHLKKTLTDVQVQVTYLESAPIRDSKK